MKYAKEKHKPRESKDLIFRKMWDWEKPVREIKKKGENCLKETCLGNQTRYTG